jgi:uncharacterized membrane protein YgcG
VLLKRALLAALIALAPVTALAQTPIPRLVSGINDPDRLLDAQRIADLSKKLAAAEQRKDIRFVVLVARDIAPRKRRDMASGRWRSGGTLQAPRAGSSCWS